MMHTVRIALLSAAAIALAGCNPFLENYRGEKFPHNATASALKEKPESAKKIGESLFYSVDDYSNEQAVSAAKDVGADFVVWEKKEAESQTDWMPQPMAIRTGTGTTGTVTTVNVPVPTTQMWYEYLASYYRKDS